MKEHYIIIGAGIAGLSAIKSIREENALVKITLLTDEDRLPYKRTKINKSIAKGFKTDEFSIYENSWYTEQKVALVHAKVKALHPKSKKVELSSGEQLNYTKLLVATGASPVIPDIKGAMPHDFLHVQNAAMVERLIKTCSEDNNEFLIIGGGIEGLETANQLVKLSKKVVVIDQLENPLKHLFPAHITWDIYGNLKKLGVEMLFGHRITTMEKGQKGYHFSVDGQSYTANHMIACTGTRPNMYLAQNAGLAINKGILIDEFLNTSSPDIYAAGDVAEHSNGMVTGLWHPAEKQGITAAKNMLGQKTAHQHIPFRLKTTLANHFYFTGNYSPGAADKYELLKQENGKTYREVYHKNNTIHAIIMVDDKLRSKIYQRAVFEQWPLDKFHHELPLPG